MTDEELRRVADDGRRGDLTLWIIYHRPRDVPDAEYVVRRWRVTHHGSMEADGALQYAASLEGARSLVPSDRVRIPRDPTDDAVVVETWL